MDPIAIEDLRFVSLSEAARLMRMGKDTLRPHWLEIRGAEITEGGRYRVPIHCLREWQANRCSNEEAARRGTASVGH